MQYNVENYIFKTKENEQKALLEYDPFVIILFDAIDCEDLERVKRYLD